MTPQGMPRLLELALCHLAEARTPADTVAHSLAPGVAAREDKQHQWRDEARQDHAIETEQMRREP